MTPHTDLLKHEAEGLCQCHSGMVQAIMDIKAKQQARDQVIDKVFDLMGAKVPQKMFYVLVTVLVVVFSGLCSIQVATLVKLSEVDKSMAVITAMVKQEVLRQGQGAQGYGIGNGSERP